MISWEQFFDAISWPTMVAILISWGTFLITHYYSHSPKTKLCAAFILMLLVGAVGTLEKSFLRIDQKYARDQIASLSKKLDDTALREVVLQQSLDSSNEKLSSSEIREIQLLADNRVLEKQLSGTRRDAEVTILQLDASAQRELDHKGEISLLRIENEILREEVTTLQDRISLLGTLQQESNELAKKERQNRIENELHRKREAHCAKFKGSHSNNTYSFGPKPDPAIIGEGRCHCAEYYPKGKAPRNFSGVEDELMFTYANCTSN